MEKEKINLHDLSVESLSRDTQVWLLELTLLRGAVIIFYVRMFRALIPNLVHDFPIGSLQEYKSKRLL